MKKKTVFIGTVGAGIPKNGESIKNFHILKKLKDFIPDLKIIDTESWGKNPFFIFKIIFLIAANRNAKFIISISSQAANRLIKIISKISPESEVLYWVIGGALGNFISEGRYKAESYKNVSRIIVEGEALRDQLQRLGLKNVIVLPNFKSLPKTHVLPDKKEDESKPLLKFVFLSRIVPSKGCDLIIEASSKLNKEGLSSKYTVDFYGEIDPTYEETFLNNIEKTPNLTYKGFLDLRNLKNYNILSGYDAMLFPTYWNGEGFAGVIIDAFSSSLPVLASDWNLNKEIIEDGKTGIIFEPKSSEAIVRTIKNCITGQINLVELGNNALIEVRKFDTEAVLSEENLRNAGII